MCHREAAQRAIQMLDNYEIHPGKFIGVCVSLDNCRLFIGSIPKDKRKEEIMEEMTKVRSSTEEEEDASFVSLISINSNIYEYIYFKLGEKRISFIDFLSHEFSVHLIYLFLILWFVDFALWYSRAATISHFLPYYCNFQTITWR